MKTNRIKQIFIRTVLFVMISSMFFAGCDTLESDSSNNDTSVTLSSNAIYITPQSSGIIDLQSLVRTNSKVKISISSQPTLGTLTSLGNDLIKYTPNTGMLNGRDNFLISVYSTSNTFLKQDSVILILSRDSTQMPCGLITGTDYVYNVNGPTDIVVLNNDTACNVMRSQLVVSIPDIEIDGVSVQKSYFGTLNVLANGIIRYTPGPNFTGSDKFIYRVDKPENLPNAGDYATLSYGFVYITSGASCKDSIRLSDDIFDFKLDTLGLADSLYLPVTNNDIFCTQALNNFLYTISEFPVGQLFYGSDYGFNYIVPTAAQPGTTDKFRYTLCVDNVCKEALVTIKFH
jgi:hypothetical protein